MGIPGNFSPLLSFVRKPAKRLYAIFRRDVLTAKACVSVQTSARRNSQVNTLYEVPCKQVSQFSAISSCALLHHPPQEAHRAH